MKTNEIKNHWTDWATTYGEQLKATTKTPTIKALEIDALVRAMVRLIGSDEAHFSVLEIGCGNGLNCLALAEIFPHASIDGVDYIPAMIESARKAHAQWGHGGI
jgi:methylase of polypeptide subunit release factors